MVHYRFQAKRENTIWWTGTYTEVTKGILILYNHQTLDSTLFSLQVFRSFYLYIQFYSEKLCFEDKLEVLKNNAQQFLQTAKAKIQQDQIPKHTMTLYKNF